MDKKSEKREAKSLALIEAALYSAGRPVEIKLLKRAIQTKSEKLVYKLVKKLGAEYDARGSALEIKELPGNRIIMQLKTRFTKMVKRFTKRPLLTKGPLKTLSYIAYNQPIEQKKIVEDRGNHVYTHLRMMEGMGLITKEKSNDGYLIVKTTPYFADYFGFSHSLQKSRLQLRQIFNMIKITKLDNGNGGAKTEESELITTLQGPLEGLSDLKDKLPESLIEYAPPLLELPNEMRKQNANI